MPIRRLVRLVSSRQHQLISLLIAVWAGALSLHFTVRACRDLSPSDSALEIAALGMLWEVSKLYFGPRAVSGLVPNRGRRYLAGLGNVMLLGLVIVLMAGSVGASVLFTLKAENRARTVADAAALQKLETGAEYRALSEDLQLYSERIAALRSLARSQLADGQRTKSLSTDARVDHLQANRDEVVHRLAALRVPSGPPIVAPGGTHAPGSTDNVRTWVHLAVAVVLEVISIAACIQFHAAKTEALNVAAVAEESTTGGEHVLVSETAQALSAPILPVRASAPFSDRYERAKRLVLSGAIRPTLHELMRAAHVSQRPAQRMQREMSSQGLIVWDGRRYVVQKAA